MAGGTTGWTYHGNNNDQGYQSSHGRRHSAGPGAPAWKGRPVARRSGENVQDRVLPAPGAGAQGTSVTVPFISAEWPGKLQKKEYGPAPSFATGTLTDVLSPPPTTLLWATTRASPGLM
jgi:hypothetical protein